MVRSILKSNTHSQPQTQPPQSSTSSSRARRPRLPSPPSPFPFASTCPSPHVHFPPTPIIVSSTYTTHSASIYDRHPIEVSPNSCALPERGGRVLHAGSPPVHMKDHELHDGAGLHGRRKGDYFHPFAYEVCEPEDLDDLPSPSSVPQLIRDCSSSSESDDSTDGYGSPHFSPIPVCKSIPPGGMSFLPHAGQRPKMSLDGRGTTRPKLKRRKTPIDTRGFCHARKTNIEEPPSLDGCLGGF